MSSSETIQYVDPYELKRKNANPSAFMSFGDESNSEEILSIKQITDIMVTFNKDPEKARKMSAKLNKKMKAEEEQKQAENDRKIQRDFDRRVRKGARRPNPKYLGKKSLYSDPLVDSLPNGMVPALPPVTDILKENEESESQEEEESSPEEEYHVDPNAKIEVGEKFGIKVDMPKTHEPTYFEMTEATTTKKNKAKGTNQQMTNNMQYFGYQPYNAMMGYPYLYDPYYAQLMFQQQFAGQNSQQAGGIGNDKFVPTMNYPSPYPMYSGVYLNAQGPFAMPQMNQYPQQTMNKQQTEMSFEKQKLMEKSGISISIPQKSHDIPLQTVVASQKKLTKTSGIQIVPRDKGTAPISLQVGNQVYSTHKNQLPSEITTNSGTITIGHVSDIKPPSVELPK